MFLIFPPVAKPSEPPAGVALLSAALKEHGLDCRVYDANIEGLLFLIQSDLESNLSPRDSWSRRALKNRETILEDIRTLSLYTNEDRYHQRVYDLNRLLSISVDPDRFRITLSDYSDNRLSSVSSRDLLKSAEQYRENPFYPFFEEKLKSRILDWDSEYIGISLCYLNQALVSFALAGWIRDNFPEKRLVMGGGLVSSWMARPDFDNPFADLVHVMIRGEGEQPLLELLNVSGTTKKHYIPDYKFAGEHDYLAPARILPFRASIGCYWSKCRFCPEKAETRPYAAQRAAKVLEDVQTMGRRHQPDVVHFIDNAMTPAFLRALSGQQLDFLWYGFVRFEKDFSDPRFCRDLKKSGCEMLKLGLESGDQEVLDWMNKGTRLELVSKTLKNLHRAGILTYVYLLFGTGAEDEDAARHTLDFVKAHKEYIDYLNLAVFNLPRFSEDADDMKTREFYHGDLSLYLNFTHPRGWDRRKVKQFLDKTFKKELAIGSRFRKNPAFFSSNHALFFNEEGEEK
ncbi:B12-binding domain-containing radical SAM protein [Desulfospira joergensenii]|uniref:B12-binding domain-containing radical SAM protein n=1 Tax=Desulfospira joergensenii TaxID=53329 RepID=UPI0003B359CD|nr:radical SAM protein [Desulfospira joergensenii]